MTIFCESVLDEKCQNDRLSALAYCLLQYRHIQKYKRAYHAEGKYLSTDGKYLSDH